VTSADHGGARSLGAIPVLAAIGCRSRVGSGLPAGGVPPDVQAGLGRPRSATAGRRSDAAPARSLALGPLGAGRAIAGRDEPPYFLIGFLALGVQHEA
jgi:hypothetical protein